MKKKPSLTDKKAYLSWQEKRILELIDGAEFTEVDERHFSKSFLLSLGLRNKKFRDKQQRLNKVLAAIVDLCNLDFDIDLSIGDNEDEIDALSLGLVTLAEEFRYHKDTLEQNNKALSMVQRLGRVGSWVYEEHSGKAILSDTLIQIYDHPEKVFENFEAFLDITHPDDRNLMVATIRKAKQNKEPFEITHRAYTGQGHIKYLESKGEVVLNNQGDIIAIQGSTLDITNLVKKQEELIRLSDQLVSSKKSLEDAQRIGKVGSWHWNPNQNHTTWSRTMYQTFGISADQRTDENTYLKYVHPEDVPKIQSAFISCRERGLPFLVVHKIIDCRGKVKWLESRGEPIFNEKEELVSVAGTVHDVTTMVQQKQQLEELNSELEELVRVRTKELESFTYSISHDLKAPLRAIVGYAEMLSTDSASLNAEQQRLANTILKNSNKLNDLINSLLGLYRIRRSKPSFELVHLESICLQLWEDINEHNSQSHKFIFHCDHIPTFKGNQPLLEQAIFNLLDNAIKYAARVEFPEIRINFKNGDEFNELIISDNGPGFDNAEASRLFQVFSRLHGPEIPGLGVGLATVKEIVQLHGGTIIARSKSNICTSFIIRLPKNQFYPDFKAVLDNIG